MQTTRRTCLVVGVAWSMSACWGGPQPEAAVQGFYAAVAQGNAEAAMAFVMLQGQSADEVALGRNKLQMLVLQGKMRVDANHGIHQLKVLDEALSEDGKQAVLQVEVTFGNGKIHIDAITLQRSEEVWKILL